MPKEGYQPSKEEVEKAEGIMIESQKVLSQRREESSKKLNELGVDGYLEYNSNKEGSRYDELPENVYGMINGHRIDVKLKINNVDKITGGSSIRVDGVNLSEDAAQKFVEKYRDAIIEYSPKELKEAKSFTKESVLKDIGL